MKEFQEIADWLQNEADKRMREAGSRRSDAGDRNMSVADLKAAKVLAEKMAGRKLDLVSTTKKANVAYCDMQDRIAFRLETEARKLSAWAEFLNSGAGGGAPR